MIVKYFPLDKNYILKEAQISLKDKLLLALVQQVKIIYNMQYNPLGLEDDTTLRINNCQNFHDKSLESFYMAVAGIYRYKYSEIQLELLFDGRSHFDKYSEEWEVMFKSWTKEFCKKNYFVRAVLQTIIHESATKQKFIESRLKSVLHEYFDVQLKKVKGIPAFKIA